MQIQVITGGILPTHSYIVTDKETNVSAVVDPGFISDELFNTIKSLNRVDAIILTHGHFDHIMGVKDIQDMTGAKIYMHQEEKDFATDCSLNLSLDFPERQCKDFKPDFLYTDGDKITVGNLTFRILYTPGHTNGSSCLIAKNVLFSGDTLFKGSIGRTDFPTSDSKKMMKSVERLTELEGNYTVYPAHGEFTTLDYERNTNPYMRNSANDFGY